MSPREGNSWGHTNRCLRCRDSCMLHRKGALETHRTGMWVCVLILGGVLRMAPPHTRESQGRSSQGGGSGARRDFARDIFCTQEVSWALLLSQVSCCSSPWRMNCSVNVFKTRDASNLFEGSILSCNLSSILLKHYFLGTMRENPAVIFFLNGKCCWEMKLSWRKVQ